MFKEDYLTNSGSFEANPHESYLGFNEEASDDVRQLARKITQDYATSDQSSSVPYLSSNDVVPAINPYQDELTGSNLDPESPKFDSKYWIKNLKALYQSDPDYFKPNKLGVAFRDLRAYGIANDFDYQTTVATGLIKFVVDGSRYFRKDDKSRYFDILKPMDGLLRPGELTVVLGRPGAGCSTLLKTLAVNTYGFQVDKDSKVSYDGLTPDEIEKHYRGDVIYSAETDEHFPQLTVGDTLEFAARLRTPQNRGLGVDRETYAKHMASVYMATYGILRQRNTPVGNEFVPGCSGGERKRVSIAEVSLSGANIQCWDNATRGLDAATALEFIRALKTSSAVLDVTPVIAIYQCSQDAYDLFDNVSVLYGGHQIFFGKANKAKEYFTNMGWYCPERQTTADFLTSLTNPEERVAAPGYEGKLPRTAQEFESYWKKSSEYLSLIADIDEYFVECEKLNTKQAYHDSHVARQSNHISPRSPYTVSFPMQVKYIMGRNFLRTKNDPSIAIFTVVGQGMMGLILSSIFYNLDQTTNYMNYRGIALFFGVLYNAFASLMEILSLFEARNIIEKHRKYALYRPSADAIASVIFELPIKFMMSITFNLIFYFMINLRREPGRFFYYWLMAIWCTLIMSHLFRCIGSLVTTVAQAMTPATVMLLAMVMYTGFVITTKEMLGWARWINYINPVAYVFESFMVNEFHGRYFECSNFVPSGPSYDNITFINRVCTAIGAQPGESLVSGTTYLKMAYNYDNTHKWRNLGICIGYALFFLVVYIMLTEFNKGAMKKGEITLFLRSSLKQLKKRKELAAQKQDIESASNEKVPLAEDLANSDFEKKEIVELSENGLTGENETFLWRDLTYEIRIKKEDRIILDHVDGWVKPGEITALMGATGAGKTTLLNCLSDRHTVGVITDGVKMVNGHSLDSSFQRSIGYVQQQDLHLQTSTVREALKFSAYLRQSNTTPDKEKDAYVDYIIDLLEMSEYADAMVGVAGSGLNIEQRKRLTIGVELVAKPKLLLFLDEPTSGLDSQTAWSICKLMRKLADHGQAILCTIHQPSALLLTEFDRLLFLQEGGQTVYFGDLGENCQTLINYFEKYGADACPKDANPAEWMLKVVGAAPGSHAEADYFQVWRKSEEYNEIQSELDKMEVELALLPKNNDPEAHLKYAAPWWKQYVIVTARTLLQNWRTPSYIYSKLFLCLGTSLFNGFSFFGGHLSLRGLQNQMFAIFLFYVPFNTMHEQMLPYFLRQRAVYEIRERPSRTFSWFAFISAQLTSEIPYQIVVGTLSFFCWYYPSGLYKNASPTNEEESRGALMWLLVVSFYCYISTMGHFCISFVEREENGANMGHFLFQMCLMFCGVLAGPAQLPGFWIFMYRCNPITYLTQAMMAVGLANNHVVCAPQEYVSINPPDGISCEQFMEDYISKAGGYILADEATGQCQFCQMNNTNEFLASVGSFYSQRWRNYGIFVAFIAANVLFSIFLYWLGRVPKGTRERKKVTKDESKVGRRWLL
ncbi:multidrug resistance protein CDR1 [Spathaspora passalidarum NRRL Y-27907]|uniref:Multidrug resistance protein CDR1 n=1 Tax=Spathaspora passalidarum (strain NRRL Y-27907 / 11-Y1) TaxID=619300 RepID=G3AFB7_SPAPN|nr:multidrug resistance protein CDR1 [Spathaspora passalidarum NRRL Y-27907]EGW34906.1 multidrug resistance protein CDR1 [Spathaspora passalidarum NRRL Y-27907]